jgi:hypothetical protein
MMANASTPHVHEDDDQTDSCPCDVEFDQSDALSDVELPPVAGGVQTTREELADEDRIDGCDLDFNGPDVTTDEELPITGGGALEAVPSEKT